MNVLVKPIKNEENPLVEGYCELAPCKSTLEVEIEWEWCGLTVKTSEDQVNFDDEILF